MNHSDKPEIWYTEQILTDDVLNALIRLSEDWEKENSCHGYRKNERSDIDGNRIFLAYAGEDIIGYLFGHMEKAKNSSSVMPDKIPFFEIEELYVRPEYRNNGIGKNLFNYTEKAVCNEAQYLMLSTATKNWKAILHFYIDELDMCFWNARLFKQITKGPC